MKLKYSLIVAVIGLLWALISQFVPDLPISPEVFNSVVLGFALYILSKLGVEVVEAPIFKLFHR